MSPLISEGFKYKLDYKLSFKKCVDQRRVVLYITKYIKRNKNRKMLQKCIIKLVKVSTFCNILIAFLNDLGVNGSLR